MVRDAFRWSLFRQVFYYWQDDRAARLGAALAYDTIFLLTPLLVIIVAIPGIVFGQEAAQGPIVARIQGLVGEGKCSCHRGDARQHERRKSTFS